MLQWKQYFGLKYTLDRAEWAALKNEVIGEHSKLFIFEN